MASLVDRHPLAREFPDVKEALHRLGATDPVFARAMHQYASLEREIALAERRENDRFDPDLAALQENRSRLKRLLHALLCDVPAA